MKSFCIKTNNIKIKNYLLKNLELLNFEDIYYIDRKFKIYNNVIVHYAGKNEPEFLNILSNIISNCILLFFEPILLMRRINLNYFYFDNFEKKIIQENCYNYITSGEDDTLKFRKDEIWSNTLKYISENKAMILEGFVNFRLENYMNTIDDIVDYSVSKYVVEAHSKLVHLIYLNEESILLDDNKNIIPFTDDIINAKYLSDISFSSNDYALNSLLTLLPERIEVHVIGYEDEFINTLKLIFGNRIFICKDCNICRTYRILTNTK